MDVPQAPPKRRPVETRISSEIRLCSRSTMPAAPIARVIDIRITYEQVIATIPAVLGKGIGDRGSTCRHRGWFWQAPSRTDCGDDCAWERRVPSRHGTARDDIRPSRGLRTPEVSTRSPTKESRAVLVEPLRPTGLPQPLVEKAFLKHCESLQNDKKTPPKKQR